VSADGAGLLLPVGTRLLHIGPQKTGTTAVQGAFHTNRAALAEHGVHYAGKTRQPRPAAAAVVLGTALPGFPADSVDRWPALVEEVRTSSADRVVISAEMFANAGEAAARTVVEAFDANRTRVVITLRPLAKIMPSQWQQFIQSGAHMSYAEFLDAMLDQPRDTSEHTQAFWHRHRHDELIERWAGVVGPDNVTVIAIDDRERRMLLDTFELLLGLPQGLLAYDTKSNSSLSLTEAEVFREFNRQFFLDKQWPEEVHAAAARYGMATYLKNEPTLACEEPIATPAWALRRADEIAVEMTTAIRRSGVHVIGALQDLRHLPDDAPDDVAAIDEVPVEVAARAVMGVVWHTTMARTPRSRRPGAMGAKAPAAKSSKPATGPTTDELTSAQLVGVVAGRARRRITRST